MLDAKEIEFTPVNGPNVVNHPMPPHGVAGVNVIDENGEILNLVMDVDWLITLLLFVKRYFIDNIMLQIVTNAENNQRVVMTWGLVFNF